MNFQLSFPFRQEPLTDVVIDNYVPGVYMISLIGERADIQVKLHEIHKAMREAMHVAGMEEWTPDLRGERQRVYAALETVLRSKTHSKVIQTILEDLKQELGD